MAHLVGVYALAGELSRSSYLQEALERYEEIMRPYVEKGQNVPKFAPTAATDLAGRRLAARRSARL